MHETAKIKSKIQKEISVLQRKFFCHNLLCVTLWNAFTVVWKKALFLFTYVDSCPFNGLVKSANDKRSGKIICKKSSSKCKGMQI